VLTPSVARAPSTHPIVHWQPNKRFAWPQSCEGFVNMALDAQSALNKFHGVMIKAKFHTLSEMHEVVTRWHLLWPINYCYALLC
jgi:hypothetical protein